MVSSFALKDRYGIMGGLVHVQVDEILPSARFAFPGICDGNLCTYSTSGSCK